jgi:hypothetical protein
MGNYLEGCDNNEAFILFLILILLLLGVMNGCH